MFPDIPVAHLPYSWTPTNRPWLAISPCAVLSPGEGRRRRWQELSFGALSYGFCARCLRFVPPSLTTTQDSLPAGGSRCRVGFRPTGMR